MEGMFALVFDETCVRTNLINNQVVASDCLTQDSEGSSADGSSDGCAAQALTRSSFTTPQRLFCNLV